MERCVLCVNRNTVHRDQKYINKMQFTEIKYRIYNVITPYVPSSQQKKNYDYRKNLTQENWITRQLVCVFLGSVV